MATIDLGKIRFNWQGAYNNSTAYVINDVVSSGGNSYICKLASTGNAVSNGTYWDLMSSAGTNGTDLTSTLTAQGDVLYRDGSGLQRLAKGTASQQLAMNSSANAPEWITPSGGGFVKIAGATFSGSTTVVINHADFDMDQAVSTGYDGYKLYLNVNSNGATNNIQMRASDDNGSSYLSTATYNYQTSGRYGGGDNHIHKYGENEWGLMQPRVLNAVTDQSMVVEMTMIKSRYTASVCFSALVQWMWQDGASAGDTATGTQALQQHSSTVDALQLISTVSTIDGCWTLYGMTA